MNVLQTLRCVGFAHLPRLADAAGLPEPALESSLLRHEADGLVVHTPGVFGGWGLTDAGRAANARLLAAELEGVRPVVLAAYQHFLLLNPLLLDLCTAWQLNDHTDPAYDARLLAQMAKVDLSVSEVCASLPRLGRYRERLTAALDRVRAGSPEHLADSLTSYHVVWFQLHEDLLVTLGIPR